MSHPDEPTESALAHQASEWVARRDRGLSRDELAELHVWERADPRHAAALARAVRAWNGMDGLNRFSDLEEMAGEVVRRARARQQVRRRWRAAVSLLGAAAAIAVGVFSWNQYRPAPPVEAPLSDSVQVLASTVRRVTLPDGSIAEINGISRIEVNYKPDARRVRLTDGEAHFIVMQDAARPFYVTAGPITVRAVGTAFNVRLGSAAVEVLVTEGKVQVEPETPSAAPEPVAPPALVAGQRALIDRQESGTAAMEVGDVARSEIEEALGWQGTRLVFSGTSLEDVVTAFNRYNRHRLTLGDPSLRKRTLTGTFRADNLEGFIRLAGSMLDVKAEQRTRSETVLLPAR